MKPAICRTALWCLLLVSLACGCATLTPSGFARRSGKTSKVDETPTTLTAGFPSLRGIRIPKPGAKAAKAREDARSKPASIKSRAEATRQANKEKEKELHASEPKIDSNSPSDVITSKITPAETVSDEMSQELAGFDQTTQALIRSELRDANPEERAQLLQDLQGVSAEMVPKILGIRRAALKYKSDPGKGKIAPTSGVSTRTQETENPTGNSEGLGTNNPWKVSYAPPPVGSGSPNNSRMNEPTFPTSTSTPSPVSHQTLMPQQGGSLPPGLSPEQLAAQVLASTNSSGLSMNGQNPLTSGLTPLQSMGMLNNGQATGMPGFNPALTPMASGLTATMPANVPPTSPYTQTPIATSVSAPSNGTGPTFGGTTTTNPGQPIATSPNGIQPQAGIPGTPISLNSNSTEIGAGLNSNGWANGNLPNYNALPTAVHSADWQQHLQGLISAAEAEVGSLTPGTTEQEKQRYIEAHVQLRMLYLMAGQQQRSLAHIPGIDAADQEFWQQVMWGTTNYFDSRQIPGAADRATQTVSQFQSASSRLREKAHLELRSLNFCNQIYGFGDIEKFQGGNEFAPGTQVLVYAEISNFKSELAADGRYHSKLKPSYEILRPGGQGQLVEQKSVATIEDVCNNHRQDFYMYFNLTIPERIGQGPHILRLTVEDELSRKITTQTLNFTVK